LGSAQRLATPASPAADRLLPLARKPLADEVYTILRRKIIRRELRPGSRITEGEITELLGVSRTPVREAFQRLAYDELLLLQPGRSPQVKPITVRSIDEAYPLIAVLEGLAIRLACRRLTEADLRHMEALTVEMERCGRTHDTESLMAADNGFHGVLHERSENTRLQKVVGDLRRRLQRLEYVFFSTPEAVKGSVKRHRWLIRVLRKRDPREAQKALEYIWGVGQESVHRLVVEYQLVGAEPGEFVDAVEEAVRGKAALGARARRPGSSVRPMGISSGVFSKTSRIGGV
jgi:DNA-binding GntR family transcriptional regulator